MTASVAERTALAADLVKLVIRTDWEQPHQAGQYLQLSLPGWRLIGVRIRWRLRRWAALRGAALR